MVLTLFDGTVHHVREFALHIKGRRHVHDPDIVIGHVGGIFAEYFKGCIYSGNIDWRLKVKKQWKIYNYLPKTADFSFSLQPKYLSSYVIPIIIWHFLKAA